MNDFINFVYVFLENKLAKSYILLASIYKGLAENFLLWLPVYLASYNYQPLIGISSFVFIFPIIIGSFVIGLMYENQADRANRITNSIFFLINLIKMLTIFKLLIYNKIVHSLYAKKMKKVGNLVKK